MTAVFVSSSLLAAFLLFQVQPIMAKAILPWFGGSPAVWTASMLFFQAALLAGYASAHGIATLLSPRRQALLYGLLLVAALAALPLEVSATWKPSGEEPPLPRIIGLLATSVGLPYLVLCATSPLLQSWVALVGRSPYPLYAVSNAGSLAALLSHPVLVEPFFTLGQQRRGWSLAFVAYSLLTVAAALRIARVERRPAAIDDARAPSGYRVIAWCVWPACASVLLLAVTNQICQDIAVVPFLWLLPLTLYLSSFIVCFAGEHGGYRRGFYFRALLVTSVVATYAVLNRASLDVRIAVPIYATYLFVACMVCHGEVFRLRPAPARLTRFYLMISLGGVLGGVAVALVAPLVFSLYFELHVAIVACLVLAAAGAIAQSPARFRALRWYWLVWIEATLAIAALLYVAAHNATSVARVATRNFYGALRVVDIQDVPDPLRRRHLVHGLTVHGFQFSSATRRRQPTTYYAPRSGVGQLLARLRPNAPRRIGALGLGVGTIAAYGRPDDEFRFFEINPLVVRLARTEFSFLADSRAKIDVVVGDGRLALERDTGAYDVLVADAFSSDAIPVHLLTEEAFRLYVRALAPRGILAIHVSNRVLDLRPVVSGAADALGWHVVFVDSDASGVDGAFDAHWALLSREAESLAAIRFDAVGARTAPPPERRILWRDDYSNLLEILR